MDADEWKNYRPVSNMTFTPKLVASRLTCNYLSDLVLNFDAAVTVMGGATGVCGGTMSPTFGTSGVQGVQAGGPMKMIFASTADSLYYK